jgi:hypothetical protein
MTTKNKRKYIKSSIFLLIRIQNSLAFLWYRSHNICAYNACTLICHSVFLITQFVTYTYHQHTKTQDIRSTIDKKALVAAESGNSSTKLWPKSQHLAIRGSRGTAPKNGTRNCFARAAAPPVVAAKILDSPYSLVNSTQANDT